MFRSLALINLILCGLLVSFCLSSCKQSEQTKPPELSLSERKSLIRSKPIPKLNSSIFELELSSEPVTMEHMKEYTDIRCGILASSTERGGFYSWFDGDYGLDDFKVTRQRNRGYDRPTKHQGAALLTGFADSLDSIRLFEHYVLKPNVGKKMCFLGEYQGLGQFHIYYAVDPKFNKNISGRPE